MILLAAHALHAASSLPLTRVVVPDGQSMPEQAAATMFVEEAARRTQSGSRVTIEAGTLRSIVAGTDVVLLAERKAVGPMLPAPERKIWERTLRAVPPARHPEGFSVIDLPWHGGMVTVIAGDDSRGELFGAGWVLRQMRFADGVARLPVGLHTTQAPEKPVRGHQLGYRFKNNTYDAWTLGQFEQQIRDLAIFGANTIQVIAPSSDDAPTSPLNPQPPLETLTGISALLKKYGLFCDLYYPEMRTGYAKPEQVKAELRDFEALVQAMPELDALYVPGGDPGHTPPELLLSLLEQEAIILHRYHPGATVWVSAQGFDRKQFETFYHLLQQRPVWLTGVFFGPQSRDSFEAQRRRIPARYEMQFYPDIAHTMHAQFPIPKWDPIYALTEGREPVCPRPTAFAAIYRHFAGLHSGFITYSEGVNDDVNKILWTQLGWSARTPADTILGQYARWFLHREGAQQQLAVDALNGLEANWNEPVLDNTKIAQTRARFAELEHTSTPLQVKDNGRWESLLYRAVYDDYLQRKLRRQHAIETAALAKLADVSLASTEARVVAASAALDETPNAEAHSVEAEEHAQLFALASQLFHDWGLQLSVKLYGASNWERGANLDRVDTPLTERVWLEQAMQAALTKPTEAQRATELSRIVDWPESARGALYDDLGDPAHEPHLVGGTSWAADPERYEGAIDGIADRTLEQPWRLSWLDYAETLYETPLVLRYDGLDARKRYRVRVTYAGEDYALPLRLAANGLEVHPPRLRSANPETVEFAIPAEALAQGRLRLSWTGPGGSGGSGRGRQVAEVWLFPEIRQDQPYKSAE